MDLLNLENLKTIEIKENEHDYAIKVETKDSTELCCPNMKCGSINFVKNGTKKNQYFWDIPMHGKRVCLVLDRQKYKCKECGTTWLEELYEIDEKRKMTIRLINYIEDKVVYKNRTFSSLANEIGVTEPTIKNVFNDIIKDFESKFNPITPKWLGIDEIHLLGEPRGIITNVSENTVIDIIKNRKQATLIEYLKNMDNKENIEVVTMDMWNPYRTAVKKVLPSAKIVVDKFHVVRMANLGLEKVRKDLRKTLTSTQRKVLKNERFVLLKRKHDLTIQEQINMEAWTKSFPVLGMAYDLKESFYSIWDIDDKDTAETVLDAWVKSIPDDIIGAFEPLINAIGNWKEEIFNYYDHKATNAYTESLNSVIRHVDRISRGYSFDVLRTKILYSHGIRKPCKPKYDNSLKHFDNMLLNQGDIVAEPTNIYGGDDLGADLSLILQKLEDGDL